MTKELSRRNWFRSEWVAPGVTRIWEPEVHLLFRANIFHIEGRDRDLVVDAGMGLYRLRPLLTIDPGKPVLAVATHIHVDHVGGLFEFEERAAHRLEASAFETMADVDTLAHLFRELEEPIAKSADRHWDAGQYSLIPAPITQVLSDGDMIDLGDRSFEVLHLPGHSPGSIGLIDRENDAFFSGDAIYPGQLLDDLPGSNREQYRQTMERIIELDVATTFGGHRMPMNFYEMRAVAEGYLYGLKQQQA